MSGDSSRLKTMAAHAIAVDDVENFAILTVLLHTKLPQIERAVFVLCEQMNTRSSLY